MKCLHCNNKSQRYHANHKTGELEHLCDYHYSIYGHAWNVNQKYFLKDMRSYFRQIGKPIPYTEEQLAVFGKIKNWRTHLR
jgi:hypothetical protein